MKSSQELKKQLRQIDHKGYKAYKVLEGEYDFGAYRLCIDHVQGCLLYTSVRSFTTGTARHWMRELRQTLCGRTTHGRAIRR